MYIEPNVQVDR